MVIFSNTPGVVGAVVTGSALPFAIAIGGNRGIDAFPGVTLVKAILTNFQYTSQSGLGVSHTLRDRIYLYAFGERAGEAQVGGIGFAGVCGNYYNYTGFDALLTYYERNRVSQRGFAARLILGPQTAIAGFLSGFTFQLEDPQTGVGAFAFRFVTMPRNTAFSMPPAAPWTTLGGSFVAGSFGPGGGAVPGSTGAGGDYGAVDDEFGGGGDWGDDEAAPTAS